MNFRTLMRFQFGQAGAIAAVARDRASLFTGLLLVLITAIPRNYDQTWILESPFWLIGPLIFSFFSGSFLFFIVYFGFIRRHLEAPKTISTKAQWLSFMSLFWMTAPVAWLYAIPVERFLNSYHAAEANLTLLAIVSLWRVVLMSRIISVMQKIKFGRALGWVLVPASLEVLLVGFNAVLSRNIMAAMAGMRHAPEEDLMTSALVNVFTATLLLLPVVLILLGMRRFRERVHPFPAAQSGRLPVAPLVLIAAIWIAIAVPAQMEQYRFVIHAKLIESGKYRESMAYLSRYTRKDFPASRRIEPNPYEWQVWKELPEVMAVLQPTDPEWIRQLYLEHMTVMFSHRMFDCSPPQMLQIFTALERLPEGKDWIRQNSSKLPRMTMQLHRWDAAPDQTTQELTNVLHRLGVSF